MDALNQSPVYYLFWHGYRPLEELKSRLPTLKQIIEDHPKSLKIALPYNALKQLADPLEKAGLIPGLVNLPSSKEGDFSSSVSGKVASEAGAKFIVIFENDLAEDKGKLKSSLTAGLDVVFCVGDTNRDHLPELFSNLSGDEIAKISFVDASAASDTLELEVIQKDSINWDESFKASLQAFSNAKRLIKLPSIFENFSLISWVKPIDGFAFFEGSQKPDIALQYAEKIFSDLPAEALYSQVLNTSDSDFTENAHGDTLSHEETIFEDSLVHEEKEAEEPADDKSNVQLFPDAPDEKEHVDTPHDFDDEYTLSDEHDLEDNDESSDDHTPSKTPPDNT